MNDNALIRQTILLHNTLSDCEKLFELLNKYLKTNIVGDETFNDIKLAAEETFSNIVNYAFPKNGEHTISAELIVGIDNIKLSFIDTGVAFNPLTDITKSFDEEKLDQGGMGIHIIRSLTDYQEYTRINECNVFTITKHYTKKQ